MRSKTSKIWSMPREDFVGLLDSATRIGDIFQSLGIRRAGGNYQTLKARAESEGLDWSQFTSRMRKKCIEKVCDKNKRSIDEFLVENSGYSRKSLKRRLITEGIFKNQCFRCGQLPEWLGEPLVLVLDHINGVHNDNRIENLRLLCPHCNSQMSTFAGRKNKGVKRSKQKMCVGCGKPVGRWAERCASCSQRSRRKVERPSIESLREDLKTMSWEAMGRKYGVSGNAVRKWFYAKECGVV